MTLIDLMIGLPTMLLCLVLQVSVTFWVVKYYIRQSARRLSGGGLLAGVRPLLVVMVVMMAGNFLQMALWGALFVVLGEFESFHEAVYHSAVNFTTLGYGDITPAIPLTRTLAYLEAIAGTFYLAIVVASLIGARKHRTPH